MKRRKPIWNRSARLAVEIGNRQLRRCFYTQSPGIFGRPLCGVLGTGFLAQLVALARQMIGQVGLTVSVSDDRGGSQRDAEAASVGSLLSQAAPTIKRAGAHRGRNGTFGTAMTLELKLLALASPLGWHKLF